MSYWLSTNRNWMFYLNNYISSVLVIILEMFTGQSFLVFQFLFLLKYRIAFSLAILRHQLVVVLLWSCIKAKNTSNMICYMVIVIFWQWCKLSLDNKLWIGYIFFISRMLLFARITLDGSLWWQACWEASQVMRAIHGVHDIPLTHHIL